MAEQSFPQIPSTVWWGMRASLQKSPRARYDEGMLAATLSVQTTASRQYLAELKRVGILDDEGKATELAGRWRMDDSYGDAVTELASANYPESLVTIAPPGEADRQRVVNWFMTQGLGEGSARNKASTYLLITSLEPGAAAQSAGKAPSAPRRDATTNLKPTRSRSTSKENRSETNSQDGGEDQSRASGKQGLMPLNVNVQIHISADATNDQIESIFASMRKYLRDD